VGAMQACIIIQVMTRVQYEPIAANLSPEHSCIIGFHLLLVPTRAASTVLLHLSTLLHVTRGGPSEKSSSELRRVYRPDSDRDVVSILPRQLISTEAHCPAQVAHQPAH
jgi:quinol-cytochrome oxidoreductase complex cytochrome b subunit